MTAAASVWCGCEQNRRATRWSWVIIADGLATSTGSPGTAVSMDMDLIANMSRACPARTSVPEISSGRAG
jgi:hypothetical protein